MGLKQFNEDVILAKQAGVDRVSRIRRGDSDGEVVFEYTHSQKDTHLEVQVLVIDIESYPKCSSLMIFTTSDHPGDDFSPFLEQLSRSMGKKNVQAIISTISEKLTGKLESSIIAIEDSDSDSEYEAGDEFAVDEYEDSEGYFDNEEEANHDLQPGYDMTASAALQLKRGLRAAQSAGITVGILPKGPVRNAEFYSLACRIKKLGIPEDALGAWDLKEDEYAVLLCRFPTGSPSLSDILSSRCDSMLQEFRFGKCLKSRPSLETARLAFSKPLGIPANDHCKTMEGVTFKDRGNSFLPLYLSNSINMLLNRELFRLVRIRRTKHLSWDAAMDVALLAERGGHHPESASINPQGNNRNGQISENTSTSVDILRPFAQDSAEASEAYFSTPLVAIQFSLRRLVRCTKYCMVCHQTMKDGFEALKPYVCSNPLCLYQYITLELGSSIEHEIVRNPYVVDILVSFFCAAVETQSLREYPTGLNLKGVCTGTAVAPADHLKAEACFKEKTVRFNVEHSKALREIRIGHFLLIVLPDNDSVPAVPTSIMNGSWERHMVQVTAIDNSSYKFDILETRNVPLNVVQLSEDEEPTHVSDTEGRWKTVMVFQYNRDIDTFNDADRYFALGTIANGIPSVLRMRAYLLQNPGKKLSSWNQMERNSYVLLHWIIASNRSLILQDDGVPTSSTPVTASEPSANKVIGLPDGWMQFRFLQGTPERERLFSQWLESAVKDGNGQSHYPTIFAWHGSPLSNWHSIIRTGLDFTTILNGRACGNGVYFSANFEVSSGYSGLRRAHHSNIRIGWRNSELRPGSALSICEIINRPDEFVCTTPHYVVDKLEWIQCRYLFVAVQPTAEAEKQPLPASSTRGYSGYVTQSPSHVLKGKAAVPAQIPLSALPANRRRLATTDGPRNPKNITVPHFGELKAPKFREIIEISDTEEEALDSDDGNSGYSLLLDSDSEPDTSLLRSMKRSYRSSRESSDSGASKLSTAAHSLKVSKEASRVVDRTDFIPGTLNLESLPKLPEPTWATSSPFALKALNHAIKDLEKTQSKENIGSLGWYIDFSNIRNVFHWIAELHTFDESLPLANDMKAKGCTSVVLELRFGSNFPYSPPFVRVIRPRFLPFTRGGGGHITAGGAICSEMLTNSGWSPALSIEKVLLQVRLGLCDLDRPARLENLSPTMYGTDYGIGEAVDAYLRAAAVHNWEISADIKEIGAVWSS